jgi:hypothetical protein
MRTRLSFLLLLSSTAILLGACSNHSAPSANAVPDSANAYASLSNAASPKAVQQSDVMRAAEALTYEDTLPIHDLSTCLAAASMVNPSEAQKVYSDLLSNSIRSGQIGSVNIGDPSNEPYPKAAFAAFLDPGGYASAKSSGDSFKMSDLEASLEPKVGAFIKTTNRDGLKFISYDDTDDTGKILTYQDFWGTHHGFPVNASYYTVEPLYSDDSTKTTCGVEPLGDTGQFSYIEVANEGEAREINALVAKHEVHPRFLMKSVMWNTPGDLLSVRVYAHILKLQLIGPDGKVLAESTGVRP